MSKRQPESESKSFQPEKAVNGNEHRFVTEAEAEAVRSYYKGFTHKALEVGDVGLRKKTQDVLRDVNTLCRLLFDNPETPSIQELLSTMDEFCSILHDQSHTFMAKLYTVLIATDVIEKYQDILDEVERERVITQFHDAIRSETRQGGEILLSSAFYIRHQFHLHEKKYLQGMSEFIKQMKVSVKTKEQEKKWIAIQACGITIAQIEKQKGIHMQVPTVIIRAESPFAEGVASDSEGYPRSVMYLGSDQFGRNRLPSEDKLLKGVGVGVPEIAGGVLNRRILRLLVGVEVATQDLPQVNIALNKTASRKLYYIYLRGLVKPKSEFFDKMSDERGYEENELLHHASFDSLSSFLSIRVSRELTDEFAELDSSEGLTEEEKQRTKIEMVKKAIHAWLDLFVKLVPTNSNIGHSVLTLALHESNKIDGQWNVEDAVNYLQKNVFALLLKPDFSIRDQIEIDRLYHDFVWYHHLTDFDKSEMALALMLDQDNILWQSTYLNAQEQHKVANYLAGQGNLGKELRKKIAEMFTRMKHLHAMRRETIRDDKTNPFIFTLRSTV